MQGPGKKIALVADVSEPLQIAAVSRIIIEKFGRCDIFVNNAAWMPVFNLKSITSNNWRKVQATNVEPIVFFAQAFVPGMLAAGWGRIVTTGSGITLSQIPDLAYMSSKGGVHAVTRALANELAGTPITVNCIAPTVVKTPGFMEHTRPEGPRAQRRSRRWSSGCRRSSARVNRPTLPTSSPSLSPIMQISSPDKFSTWTAALELLLRPKRCTHVHPTGKLSG